MGVSKINDHIQINIKMTNTSQEPPASSKAPYQDLKDIAVLCTFKITIERKKWNNLVSKTSDHIHIKIKLL